VWTNWNVFAVHERFSGTVDKFWRGICFAESVMHVTKENNDKGILWHCIPMFESYTFQNLSFNYLDKRHSVGVLPCTAQADKSLGSIYVQYSIRRSFVYPHVRCNTVAVFSLSTLISMIIVIILRHLLIFILFTFIIHFCQLLKPRFVLYNIVLICIAFFGGKARRKETTRETQT
jgi:hypothetical protein